MFLFYVPSFFKKGDTIQGGTLFKKGHYLRKYGTYQVFIHRVGTFATKLDLARPCKTQWVEIFSLEVFNLNAHDIS